MSLFRGFVAASLLGAFTIFTSSQVDSMVNIKRASPTISFVNPAALQVTVGEGDDFASRVLVNPWDMNERRDIGYEIGLNNISASNGVWQGTFDGVDYASGGASGAYFFPLFEGFSSPTQGTMLSQELAWNPIGAQDKYAIDTSKYTQLSFRMYTSARSQYVVHWTGAKPVNWPMDQLPNDGRFVDSDGCYTSTNFIYWPAGWRTYYFDLTQNNGDPNWRVGNWRDQSRVRGLRIDPSAGAPVGTQVKVDWIRLTDPSSSPTVQIQWNGSGFAANDLVDIWIADNPNGTDALSPVIRSIPATAGSYSFKTSTLAPGQHYFRLKLMSGPKGCGSAAERAATGWVGPLTIVGEPTLKILKPSTLSGEDYATSELGNPWDMSDASDIGSSGVPETLADKQFTNGAFCARAINDGRPYSDSQFLLNTGNIKPIDTTKYRYFSIRMKVDPPFSGKDINWAILHGWGSRILWWNNGIQADGSESKYGFLYEGWRTYVIDLAKAVLPASLISNPAGQADNILVPREEDSYPAQSGWTQIGSTRYLRFDPLETTASAVNSGADVFCIDWIKLTAQDRSASHQPYPIQYTYVVNPSQPTNLTFYYTTNPSTNPTPSSQVAQRYTQPSIPPSSPYQLYLPMVLNGTDPIAGDTFMWDTSGVSTGTYYICVKANDGSNQPVFCSETPVNIQ
jgi:hypothetical protein